MVTNRRGFLGALAGTLAVVGLGPAPAVAALMHDPIVVSPGLSVRKLSMVVYVTEEMLEDCVIDLERYIASQLGVSP